MNEYAPCPKCGSYAGKKVSFTWWGGALGPALLKHVKCGQCGTAYNGRTGQSNTNGILLYTLVSFAIAFGVLFALRSTR